MKRKKVYRKSPQWEVGVCTEEEWAEVDLVTLDAGIKGTESAKVFLIIIVVKIIYALNGFV